MLVGLPGLPYTVLDLESRRASLWLLLFLVWLSRHPVKLVMSLLLLLIQTLLLKASAILVFSLPAASWFI